MTLQLDLNYSIQRLLRAGGNVPGWQVSLDGQALVFLSVLAAYSVLKGRRWMRYAVTAYLAGGVGSAVARLLVGVRLDSMVVINMSSSSASC